MRVLNKKLVHDVGGLFSPILGIRSLNHFFHFSDKDIRPTYAGSKSSAERLKRGIVYARILVRDCLMETERSARN